MVAILIIDDDPEVCETLISLFRRLEYTPRAVHTLSDGLAAARDDEFDLVFLDVNMPDGCGLDLIEDLRQTPGEPEVIILTGMGSADGAETAIRNNAWDYLEKGSSINEIVLACKQALLFRRERREDRRLVALRLEGIIGSSPPMQQCYDLIAQAASSDVNVLICGDTGTGKELVANAIHQNSQRSSENFVVVDCASLPPTMIGSMLFGHVKGAFTGADRFHKGLIAQAEGGTLFLDEVGELPPDLQKVFLRVLQEHCYRPLGSEQEQQSDFRLIAATNRSLEEMVEAGCFRRDLLFRLKTLEIELPSLKQRNGDLRSLVDYHLQRIARRCGSEVWGGSSEFLRSLEAYDWPGNVRELVNALEYAGARAGHNQTLYGQHLPREIRIAGVRNRVVGGKEAESAENAAESLPNLREYRFAMDRIYLERVMRMAAGDVSRAVKLSGLSRSAFYQLLQKHRLSDS